MRCTVFSFNATDEDNSSGVEYFNMFADKQNLEHHFPGNRTRA